MLQWRNKYIEKTSKLIAKANSLGDKAIFLFVQSIRFAETERCRKSRWYESLSPFDSFLVALKEGGKYHNIVNILHRHGVSVKFPWLSCGVKMDIHERRSIHSENEAMALLGDTRLILKSLRTLLEYSPEFLSNRKELFEIGAVVYKKENVLEEIGNDLVEVQRLQKKFLSKHF